MAEPAAKKAKTGGEELPSIALKYWDGRGLMEVPRMMLALAGKFPGDYKDGRYGTDYASGHEKSYADVKDSLSANLGRMPVLVAGDTSIGQSNAINYYLASELGFMGAGFLEGAQIIAIQEHVKEMSTAYRAVCPYGEEPTEENLSKWFTEGAEDASPAAADMSRKKERYFKWFAGRIEGVLPSTGVSVGSSLSLADLLIYNLFAETLQDSEAADSVAQYRREPFGSKAKTDAGLAAFPNISNVCATVAATPQIAKWLGMRGINKF